VKGGIGKNLLVDKILHLIFDGQTVSLLTDNALGQFNSLIKGRAVALVDESAADTTQRHGQGVPKLSSDARRRARDPSRGYVAIRGS
jgi:hypothetical protein